MRAETKLPVPLIVAILALALATACGGTPVDGNLGGTPAAAADSHDAGPTVTTNTNVSAANCGPGTKLVGDACEIDTSTQTTVVCGDGTVNVNNVCQLPASGSFDAGSNQAPAPTAQDYCLDRNNNGFVDCADTSCLKGQTTDPGAPYKLKTSSNCEPSASDAPVVADAGTPPPPQVTCGTGTVLNAAGTQCVVAPPPVQTDGGSVTPVPDGGTTTGTGSTGATDGGTTTVADGGTTTGTTAVPDGGTTTGTTDAGTPAPTTPTCTAGTHLANGTCVADAPPPPPNCGTGTVLNAAGTQCVAECLTDGDGDLFPIAANPKPVDATGNCPAGTIKPRADGQLDTNDADATVYPGAPAPVTTTAPSFVPFTFTFQPLNGYVVVGYGLEYETPVGSAAWNGWDEWNGNVSLNPVAYTKAQADAAKTRVRMSFSMATGAGVTPSRWSCEGNGSTANPVGSFTQAPKLGTKTCTIKTWSDPNGQGCSLVANCD